MSDCDFVGSFLLRALKTLEWLQELWRTSDFFQFMQQLLIVFGMPIYEVMQKAWCLDL
jgi:hypothetical protein